VLRLFREWRWRRRVKFKPGLILVRPPTTLWTWFWVRNTAGRPVQLVSLEKYT
jgi:hypothetical protein